MTLNYPAPAHLFILLKSYGGLEATPCQVLMGSSLGALMPNVPSAYRTQWLPNYNPQTNPVEPISSCTWSPKLPSTEPLY